MSEHVHINTGGKLGRHVKLESIDENSNIFLVIRASKRMHLAPSYILYRDYTS